MNGHVLHVAAPGATGGLERVVQMLAAAQGRRASVAAVVSPGEGDRHPFVAELRDLGIAVHPIAVGARSYIAEHHALRALIAQVGAGVVHTHGYRPDVIAGFAARRERVASVSTVHGFTGGSRRDLLYEYVQCRALRRADAVVAVSRALGDRLAATGIARAHIHVVPNAYAPSRDVLSRDVARGALGLAPDAQVVGWVGRLSHEKGADVMLRALAESEPVWRLSVAGDGSERAALQALARDLGVADRVTFHGAVPQAGALLAAFDVLVLSSRTEGTPIVLLEAMAAGVPVIATRVGGVPDVVRDAEALLVAPEAPREIADALRAIARDPARAGMRVTHARERVRTAYAVDAWVRAIDTVYEAARA